MYLVVDHDVVDHVVVDDDVVDNIVSMLFTMMLGHF